MIWQAGTYVVDLSGDTITLCDSHGHPNVRDLFEIDGKYLFTLNFFLSEAEMFC